MKRSSITVMRRLLTLVKPLTGTMILAVAMGVLGHLCAIFIPVLGGMAITGSSVKMVCIILPVIAVLRGIFHLLEQNRNHYLAFKLLALIRDQVFGALRKLAPAKLEGQDKGNLIAILTADIELLEVFYAHTIKPCIYCSLCICYYDRFYWKLSSCTGSSDPRCLYGGRNRRIGRFVKDEQNIWRRFQGRVWKAGCLCSGQLKRCEGKHSVWNRGKTSEGNL